MDSALTDYNGLQDKPQGNGKSKAAKLFPCRKGCQKTFSLHSTRGRHEREQHGEEKFPCTVGKCAHICRSSRDLKRHKENRHKINTHQEYLCSFEGCNSSLVGQGFTNAYELKKHENAHGSVLCPYKGCDRAIVGFAKSDTRDLHVRRDHKQHKKTTNTAT